jgi:6-phosphofructokinase 1
MGRHAGWITAACGLASEKTGQPPHLLLFPEIPFREADFLARVDQCVKQNGYCVIGVSEGIQDEQGRFLSESGLKDAFGHAQLGGVAPVLANLIREKLGYKYHWAVADYLQRAARHIASKTDVAQAYAMGKAAVELALKGQNAVMPTVVRISHRPYKWKVGSVPLSEVANQEKMVPRHFITPDGYGITSVCRRYLEPLIEGEDHPPYRKGLPDYVTLKKKLVKKKLKTDFKV